MRLEPTEGGQATFSAAHEDRKNDSTLRSRERKPQRANRFPAQPAKHL